jgi:hypothetical protein
MLILKAFAACSGGPRHAGRAPDGVISHRNLANVKTTVRHCQLLRLKPYLLESRSGTAHADVGLEPSGKLSVMGYASWLFVLPAFAMLAGCAHQSPVRPFAQFRTYAPASQTIAELPRSDGGSESYQSHRGASFTVGSAAAIDDTGSERIPDYPAGAEAPVQGGQFQMIMPNGGNRPVESVNSLPN